MLEFNKIYMELLQPYVCWFIDYFQNYNVCSMFILLYNKYLAVLYVYIHCTIGKK